MLKHNLKQSPYQSPVKGKSNDVAIVDNYDRFSPRKATTSNIRVLRTNLVYAIGLWP